MPVLKSARNKIVNTALKLFYKQGIRGTSVDLIIQKSGVHKSTFFKHFPTKTDVIVAFLERRDQQWMNWLAERVDALATKPENKLLAIFEALGEWFAEPDFRGCAFINTVAESPNVKSIEFLRSVEHRTRVAAYVAELVSAAGLKRQDAIVEEFLLLIEGAIVRAQMGAEAPASTSRRIAKVLIADHS